MAEKGDSEPIPTFPNAPAPSRAAAGPTRTPRSNTARDQGNNSTQDTASREPALQQFSPRRNTWGERKECTGLQKITNKKGWERGGKGYWGSRAGRGTCAEEESSRSRGRVVCLLPAEGTRRPKQVRWHKLTLITEIPPLLFRGGRNFILWLPKCTCIFTASKCSGEALNTLNFILKNITLKNPQSK